MPDLHTLDHIALAVRDVAASAAWYADVLGLKRVHADVWGDVPTMMAAGNDTMLALFPVKVAPGSDPKPPPGKDVIAMRHFAFRTDRPAYAMQAKDGTIIEVFEWKSEEHAAQAHENPVVLEMWKRFESACEYVTLRDLAETESPFPNFEPVDLSSPN